MEVNKENLRFCFFYKGERRNPFPKSNITSTYWELEGIWANSVADNEILNEEYISNFAMDFPNLLDEVSKKVRTSLKAFMYDQYCHCGGSKTGFPSWFQNYVIASKATTPTTSSPRPF